MLFLCQNFGKSLGKKELPMTKEQKEMFKMLKMANYTLNQKDNNAFTAQSLFEAKATVDNELDEQVRPVAQVLICPLTQ